MARKTIALAEKEEVDKLKNPEFTQAEVRNNIESQESMFTILGKIKKFFTDLKIHAFNDTANNLVTTESGYALDARQGKALQDKIGSKDISGVGGTLTDAISALNSNLSLVAGIFPANRVVYEQIPCDKGSSITIDLADYINTTKQLKFTVCIKAENSDSAHSYLWLTTFGMWYQIGSGGNTDYGTGLYYMRCTSSFKNSPTIAIGEVVGNGNLNAYKLSIVKNEDNTLSITNNGVWTNAIGILVMPTEFEQLTDRFDDIYVTKDQLQSIEDRISALESI